MYIYDVQNDYEFEFSNVPSMNSIKRMNGNHDRYAIIYEKNPKQADAVKFMTRSNKGIVKKEEFGNRLI